MCTALPRGTALLPGSPVPRVAHACAAPPARETARHRRCHTHLHRRRTIHTPPSRRVQVVGVLKGYDALLNLVLDETKEFLKDPDDPYRLLDDTRTLGLTVLRGTSVMLVCPTDGFEEIANPFLDEEEQLG